MSKTADALLVRRRNGYYGYINLFISAFSFFIQRFKAEAKKGGDKVGDVLIDFFRDNNVEGFFRSRKDSGINSGTA